MLHRRRLLRTACKSDQVSRRVRTWDAPSKLVNGSMRTDMVMEVRESDLAGLWTDE